MTAGRTDTPRPRTARALALAGAMGLAALAVVARDHGRRLAGLDESLNAKLLEVRGDHGRRLLDLRADVDRYASVRDSRAEDDAALRDWSRRDDNDDLWPGVARRESPDRPPSEGGLR